MSLTGSQLHRLAEAIRHGYTRDELRRLVRICLDEDFDALVADKPYATQVFELVEWANRRGAALDLLRCARENNPGNGGLQKVWAEFAPPVWTPSFEIEWITIPAGEFLMGSDKDKDPRAADNELPQHRVFLPEYRIAKYPITNTQYFQFIQATGHRPPWTWKNGTLPPGKERHPVVDVRWVDAVAYCQWASTAVKCTIQLPSEAQWEKAARGTDGRIWPWGNQRATSKRCNYNDNVRDTTPVDMYPQGASPYGVMDMVGNVGEWTTSKFKAYPYIATDGREDVHSENRAWRGGIYFLGIGSTRCADRSAGNAYYNEGNVGFRVITFCG